MRGRKNQGRCFVSSYLGSIPFLRKEIQSFFWIMARKPWARAVELVTSSQESEDQLVEDHVSVSDSESQALTSAFWLPLIKRHTADLVVVHRREPINVVSSCTGSCAEGAVLKETMTTWVFPKIVVPQNGWFIMETLIKMDGLGVLLFLETFNCSNKKTTNLL